MFYLISFVNCELIVILYGTMVGALDGKLSELTQIKLLTIN